MSGKSPFSLHPFFGETWYNFKKRGKKAGLISKAALTMWIQMPTKTFKSLGGLKHLFWEIFYSTYHTRPNNNGNTSPWAITERLEIGLHIWSTLGWHKTSAILVNSIVSDWIQNDCSGQCRVQNFISLEQDIPSNEGVYQFSITCSVTRGGGGALPYGRGRDARRLA